MFPSVETKEKNDVRGPGLPPKSMGASDAAVSEDLPLSKLEGQAISKKGRKKRNRKLKDGNVVALENFRGGFENIIVPGRVKCDCQGAPHPPLIYPAMR